MSYINQNIKHLRRLYGHTQARLAQKVGIKRSLIGAYEEGRAEPKIETIQKLSYILNVSLDQFINHDLTKTKHTQQLDTKGKTLRVLPIVVDTHNKEKISIVPIKARAGYAQSYHQTEYIQELPSFHLPITELYPDKTYRIFQIDGDSMLPINPQSYIICEYIENWEELKQDQTYILITKNNGVLYKRVWQNKATKHLTLKSDNTEYQPFELELNEILEIWKGLGFMTFDMPSEDKDSGSIDYINSAISQLQQDIESLKEKINKSNPE